MKKLLVFLLSLTICLTPTLTFAGAEKWTLVENFYDSSKNVVKVTARKVGQQASNNALYKVQVPVTASATGSTVASMIRLGVAGALIYGVVEGVGWIIENGIVKKPSQNDKPKIYWSWIKPWDDSYKPGFSQDTRCKGVYGSYSSALDSFVYCTKTYDNAIDVSCKSASSTNYLCTVTRSGSITNTSITQITDPNGTDNVYVPVPDQELGEKINNSPQAPQILPDVYSPNNPAGGPASESTSDALDNALPEPEKDPTGGTKPKPNVDTDGDGIPDQYDPEKPSLGDEFTLPAFCEWAVTVCEWYVKYKEDSQKIDIHREKEKTFWEKVTDWFDWTKEEPDDNDDNEVETKEQPEFDNSVFRKDRFNVSQQCPVPEQHTISLSGISTTFSFDLTPICSVLNLARPALIACSYLYAAYIIIGASRNG